MITITIGEFTAFMIGMIVGSFWGWMKRDAIAAQYENKGNS